MKVSISIDKKIIDKVKGFCKLNGRNYLEYITEAIDAKLSVDMYGDLNEKMKKREKPKIQRAEEYIKEKTKKVKEEKETVTKEILETQPLEIEKVETPKTENVEKVTKRRILNSK